MFFGQHKDIVCFANSSKPLCNEPYKTGGHCVAGKEVGNLKWFRPVSAVAETGALTLNEINLGGNTEPKVLDIIRIPVLNPRPECAQPENWLIDSSKPWSKIGQYDIKQIQRLLDKPDSLWENVGGKNDRVSADSFQAVPAKASLYLIQPTNLVIHNVAGFTGKQQIRATFSYNGVEYDFVVTDPPVKEAHLRRGAGQYPVNPGACLSISLTESFKGAHYKVIAAVI